MLRGVNTLTGVPLQAPEQADMAYTHALEDPWKLSTISA